MAITKRSLVDDAFSISGRPCMEVIKVSSGGPDKGWFDKRGSYLTEKRAKLEPKEGYTPLFTSVMGSYNKHGYNRNADAWPEEQCKIAIHNPKDDEHRFADIEAGLKEQHPTFVKVAKVYRNHNNTDPEMSSGFTHSSNYNDRQGRVEVIAYFKNAEWEDEIEALHNGKNTRVSMTARVKNDVCSECGNEATVPSAYCRCLNMDKGAILEDGHQVGMINNKPVFRDLSGVRMNADRIGYGLGIVSIGDTSEGRDKEASLSSKSASEICHKLADIEKRIEAGISPADGKKDKKIVFMAKSLPRDKEIPDTMAKDLKSVDPCSAFKEMSKRKVVLPFEGFSKTLMGPKDYKKNKTIIIKTKNSLPGLFNRMMRGGMVEPLMKGKEEYTDTPQVIIKIAANLAKNFSVDESLLLDKQASHIPDSAIAFTCESSTTPITIAGSLQEKLAVAYGNYVIDAVGEQLNDNEKQAAILQNYIK